MPTTHDTLTYSFYGKMRRADRSVVGDTQEKLSVAGRGSLKLLSIMLISSLSLILDQVAVVTIEVSLRCPNQECPDDLDQSDQVQLLEPIDTL